jgi:hypothetical protein
LFDLGEAASAAPFVGARNKSANVSMFKVAREQTAAAYREFEPLFARLLKGGL